MINKERKAEKLIIKKDIAIIGGGIGGVTFAIEAARKGYSVVLAESKEQLLEGTSDCTPGRMGLGFHYVHSETAIMYLRSTIEFTKKYLKETPHLRIGEKLPENHYLRRGQYFITKDSLFSETDILKTYKKIQAEYSRLCLLDPSNRVFGDPANFFRILNPSEYTERVNVENIACGIETAEHLLDWENFKAFLIQTVDKEKKIKVLPNCEIRDIDFDSNTFCHILIPKKEGPVSYAIHAPFVINSTWAYVQEITHKAGFILNTSKENTRTNRLKILVEVELPPELIETPSMFFCMGPHCMFSNMGNGRGCLTFAPVTNFMNSTEIIVPNEIVTYLNANPEQPQIEKIRKKSKKYGEKIIAGVAEYIPQMAKAKLVSVKFGVVITKGNVNIFAHDSPFHQRNYSGIEYNFPVGWINNTCMKLLYGYSNAMKLLNVLEEHTKIKESIYCIVCEILAKASVNNAKLLATLNPVLLHLLTKYYTFNELLTTTIPHFGVEESPVKEISLVYSIEKIKNAIKHKALSLSCLSSTSNFFQKGVKRIEEPQVVGLTEKDINLIGNLSKIYTARNSFCGQWPKRREGSRPRGACEHDGIPIATGPRLTIDSF